MKKISYTFECKIDSHASYRIRSAIDSVNFSLDNFKESPSLTLKSINNDKIKIYSPLVCTLRNLTLNDLIGNFEICCDKFGEYIIEINDTENTTSRSSYPIFDLEFKEVFIKIQCYHSDDKIDCYMFKRGKYYRAHIFYNVPSENYIVEIATDNDSAQKIKLTLELSKENFRKALEKNHFEYDDGTVKCGFIIDDDKYEDKALKPLMVEDTKKLYDDLKKELNNEFKNNNVKEENNNMSMNNLFEGLNLEFGKIEDDAVRVSHLGLAIKNKEGKYVTYSNGNLVDTSIIDLKFLKRALYKIPVATNAIKAGDVIIHNKKYLIVTDISNGIEVIDSFEGEIKKILPTTNLFGFNYYTKVITLIDLKKLGKNASTDNPFGDIIPMMMMSQMFEEGNSVETDVNMMEMMMMSQMFGGDQFKSLVPMMMMSQMSGGKNNGNMMEMMMMSQMFGGGLNPFESLLGMFGGETSKEQTVAELKAEKEKLEKELNALKDSLTKL